MFSALKKWAKGSNDDVKGSMPSGVRAMGQALQRKFARGIQFNMKIVIKGDRNTGKSCLFQRLQGKSFNEQYIPTNEIQVASIHWNYRTTDDVVKVEVWDVVDKGRSKKTLRDNLKLENDTSEGEKDSNVLDAEFVDVFKGAHGVMMIMDITKPWTFQYIQRELPKVPPHLPVLVLASHRDMGEHRLVQADEVIAFIEHLERPDRSPPVHYAEASMKNSFGLKYIHKFLNLPFLLLQRETLLKQLQVNSEDLESTLEELQIHKESEDQDYDKFVSLLERRKKDHEAKKAAAAAAAVAAAAAAAAAAAEEAASEKQPTVTPALPSHEPSTDNTAIPRGSAKFSATDIDEFVPDDELDAGFLDDEGTGTKKRPSKPAGRKPPSTVQLQQQESDESESDSDTRNPMVAGFTEDLDSEDESSGARPVTKHVHKVENNSEQKNKPVRRAVPTTVEITSSEEERDEEQQQRNEIGKDKTRKGKQSAKVPVTSPMSGPAADNIGLECAEVNDWLNSPDADPKTPFSTSSENKTYSVSKVEVGSSPLTPSAPIDMDEWDRFMALQMQPQSKGTVTPTGALIDMDANGDNEEEANEEGNRSKKQEHKSGEKSRSKHKHKRHKDKSTEGEGEKRNKERRRSRHKEGERDKGSRKSKDEGLEKKTKSNPRHSRSQNEEGSYKSVAYEEL